MHEKKRPARPGIDRGGIMADGEETTKIHRGLKGVYMDRSAASFIDGRAGELRYRG